MGRILRTSLPVSIILLLMSLFLLCSGCQTEPAAPASPTGPPPSTSASPPETEGEIVLLSSSTEVDYPTALAFIAELESPADIDSIKLEYSIDKITTVWLITQIRPDFEPSPKIEVRAELEMKKTGGLPPGSEITYQWKVGDTEERSMETEPATVIFEDSRYHWNSLSEDNITLYWYEGPESFAQELMGTALGTLEKLDTDTGAQLQRPVKIFIYSSSDDFRGSMINPQQWAGGVSYSEFGIVSIGISPDKLEWGKRTTSHELAHLVTYQMTYNPYNDIPTWLNEGLSMYAEGDLTTYDKGILEDAISRDELVSVRSLSSPFPAQGSPTLYYAESYSLIKFLIDTYGRDKMLQLLDVFKNCDSYDDALMEVYGFDTDGLEKAWRSSL